MWDFSEEQRGYLRGVMMAVCHRRATWILSCAWRDLLLLGWPQNVPRWWGCLSLCCPEAPWGFYGLGTLSSCRHLSMQKRASERKDTVVPHMDSHAPLCQVSCITLSLNIDLYMFSFFFVFLSFFSRHACRYYPRSIAGSSHLTLPISRPSPYIHLSVFTPHTFISCERTTSPALQKRGPSSKNKLYL